MKNHFLFFLLFSLVLVSRLPFLNAGYGNDQDGWRIAAAARYIATSGEYKASRLPGFPVVELTCSLLWKYGAWAMNLVSALTSAVAVGMLSLIAKRYECRNPVLLALTFAFTPVVFISSTITMDYMWAMMFVILCWYAGLKGKPIIAGLLLGIATGCRITTLAFALPLALLFFEKQNWKLSILRIIKFWVAGCAVSTFAFLPVFLTYGMRFFTYFDQGQLSIITIIRFVTYDVWGAVGVFVFAAIPVFFLINRRKSFDPSIPKTIPHNQVRVWSAVIGLFIIEFALLPNEGAYLIPAIPFFLLLLAHYLSRTQFVIICMLIILSSLVVSIDSADRPWSPDPSPYSIRINSKGRMIAVDFLRGPIFNNYVQRKHRIEFVKEVIHTVDHLNEPSAIIVGPWLPYIIEMTPNAIPESEFPDYFLQRGNVKYVPCLTAEFFSQFQHEGRRLYYLVTVDRDNMNVTGLDIKQAGAVELKVE